jgi:hypothetical protein
MGQRRQTEGPTTVSPREFIRVWQTSASVAEVASKVRRKKNACRVRAYRYRQMGVPLKVFPPVEVELPDWDELADYAASLLPDGEARKAAGQGDSGDDREGDAASAGEGGGTPSEGPGYAVNLETDVYWWRSGPQPGAGLAGPLGAVPAAAAGVPDVTL